jgi:hypothetical protein
MKLRIRSKIKAEFTQIGNKCCPSIDVRAQIPEKSRNNVACRRRHDVGPDGANLMW